MRGAEAAPESRPTLRSTPNGALEGTGVDAAVDQEVLAGDVARLDAAQIGAELAELLGRAEAAGRNRLLPLALDLLGRLALLLRGKLGVADEPVGPEAPGKDIVDRDVVRDRFAGEARDEAGEAAARAVRERELRDRRLHRARGDVDDAPEALRDHPVHRGLDQLDRRQHVRADGFQPLLARELAEVPRRRAARVGDEDVRLRAGGERRDAALFAGDVRRHGDYGRAGGGADLIRGLLQRLALARDQGDAAAFARERGRASPPEPLACAAYERGLAANFEVHDLLRKGMCVGLARRVDDKIISSSAPEPRPRRSAMAGHSRWANVKHKKAAADAKKGKIFTRLIKEVTVAARLSGADPAMNPRLRLAIDKAYDANMPKDTIERAAKRGAGGLEGVTYEEVRYEGYGPGGAAVMVDCMTDNRIRTVAEVRHAFAKHGGNLGTDGSVAFLFKHCGQFVFAPGTSEEKVMEAALDAGAEDVVRNDDGSVEVICAPSDFTAVKDGLAKAGLKPDLADITMKPTAENVLKGDEEGRMQKLLDALENLDDVQDVYTTALIDQ